MLGCGRGVAPQCHGRVSNCTEHTWHTSTYMHTYIHTYELSYKGIYKLIYIHMHALTQTGAWRLDAVWCVGGVSAATATDSDGAADAASGGNGPGSGGRAGNSGANAVGIIHDISRSIS